MHTLVPKTLTIQRSDSSGCCSTTSLGGISSPRASRSRESQPVISSQLGSNPTHLLRVSQLQSYSRRIFQMQIRLSERHAGLLHIRTRFVPKPSPHLNQPPHETTAPPVSHHPPISAFFYISPANHVKIIGELRPKSKFLGNSVSTTMEGENRVTLLGKPEDGGTSLVFFMRLAHSLTILAADRVCDHDA